MAPPKTDFDRQMAALEVEIKKLETEYNQFFAGRLPRMPWDQRAKVDQIVKRMDRTPIQNTADRFRFQTVQTRYAMFCQLWERQMSALEGGRPRKPGMGGPPPLPAPEPDAAAESPAPQAEAARPAAAPPTRREPARASERLVHVAMVKDPTAEPDRVKELYERLAEAKREAGEAPVPFDRVAALVRAQVDKLRDQGQGAAFRVAMKDGKVSLTVKPVTGDGDE